MFEQNDNKRLEVVDVHKDFGGGGLGVRRNTVTALDGVSLSVGRGKTVAIVGESGSGKTTLGRVIAGLLTPDSGEVRLADGQHPSRRSQRRARRRFVQMVFQNPLRSFSPTLSVGSTLRDALRLAPRTGKSDGSTTIRELFSQVGIDPAFISRRPGEMSGGQLQRVGIVRALVPEPSVIVLDEPTSALDVSLHGQIVNLLVDIQRRSGVSYVLISHDLRVARAMADEIVVMYLGQVVERGLTSDVLDNPRHPYTRAMLDAAPQGTQGIAREKLMLRGEVSRPLPDDFGCKLRARCPLAVDRCANPQEMVLLGSGHEARCWRTGEINANHPVNQVTKGKE